MQIMTKFSLRFDQNYKTTIRTTQLHNHHQIYYTNYRTTTKTTGLLQKLQDYYKNDYQN